MSIEELKAQREAALAKADAITDAAIEEKRSLTEDEKRDHDAATDEARGLRELIETRAKSAEEAERQLPDLKRAIDANDGQDDQDEDSDQKRDLDRDRQRDNRRRGGRNQLPVYHERAEHSFFVDVWNGYRRGHSDALRRLDKSDEQVIEEMQQRDLANVTNKGAEAVVPLFLQDKFEKARIARATTSMLTNQQVLPVQGDSITIPIQTGSAAVASLTQADGLNTLQETNAAFDVATENIIEVGGTQDISNYVIDRGTLGVGIDVVIANHLSELLAKDEDERVLAKVVAGAGVSVTYTATTGRLYEIYKKVADAVQQIHTGNLMPPTGIVVHPRRFAAWASELDSTNRPLMVPMSVAQNPLAFASGDGSPVAQGFTGYAIHGLPIYTDPNATITNGAGTNEDIVLIADWKQQYTWLGPVMVDVDPSPMFKQSGKTVRARRYFATMVGHRDDAFAKISGTGLATPSFS